MSEDLFTSVQKGFKTPGKKSNQNPSINSKIPHYQFKDTLGWAKDLSTESEHRSHAMIRTRKAFFIQPVLKHFHRQPLSTILARSQPALIWPFVLLCTRMYVCMFLYV